MEIPSLEHVQNSVQKLYFVLTFRTIYAQHVLPMFWACSFHWTGKSMNNRLSYCGLVDPRISASDKELLVLRTDTNHKHLGVDILLYCKSHPLENWSDFIKMLYVILLKQTLQFIQYF